MISSVKKNCMLVPLIVTRNEDLESTEGYLRDSGSQNRNVEVKCCYLDVILVGVSLTLKLGIS